MTDAPRAPISTYRLQLPALSFRQARELIPYFQRLGVSDVYVSPVLQARAGTTHGYDVTDPTRLHAELGDEADFDAFADALREEGLGLLLDIVPNHMASAPASPWWADVLEHGRSSPYAHYFDIDWRSGGAAPGQLLRPVLGDRYGRVLERGELRLGLDERGLHVAYFERRAPLDPRTYPRVLEHGPAPAPLRGLAAEFAELPDREDVEAGAERRRRASALKARLWALYTGDPAVRTYLDATITELNGRPGDPASFDALDALLLAQPYRLVYWQLATRELNYRRFFDISDLVGVRVEDADVFEATHALILRLVAEEKVQGLRIDHVDGLLDPTGYLERLQRRIAETLRHPASAPPAYVVVEKILSGDEALPAEWPVAGTTGYEFAATLTPLFVDRNGLRSLDDTWHRFVRSDERFADVVYRKKKQLMAQLFAGEVADLTAELSALARQDRHARDVAEQQLARALVEVTAALPVYRTYTRGLRVAERDRARIHAALHDAGRRVGAADVALDFLRRVLLLEPGGPVTPQDLNERLHWVMRWQQFTGPVMAKGVEDSALYTYNRLLSMNEVGADPGAPPTSVDDLHEWLRARLRQIPASLNATSTHDTKRSEDVRARLSVLSEMPAEWRARLRRWRALNRPLKSQRGGAPVPDAREELFIYQTLVGAWPLHDDQVPAFRERLHEYLTKALREAREHSSWIAPAAEYERAVLEFADRLLDPAHGFLADLLELQQVVARHGAANALAQLAIKLVAPGVPDFYQGTELWDLSLVDPDNRRPVDFALRRRLLDDLDAGAWDDARLAELLDGWHDGRVKLLVTARGARLRREAPQLFARGDYHALSVSGRRRAQVFACARSHGGEWALAIAPTRSVGIAPPGAFAIGDVWGAAAVHLPAGAPRRWRDVLTGAELEAEGPRAGRLPLARALRALPVALLHARE